MDLPPEDLVEHGRLALDLAGRFRDQPGAFDDFVANQDVSFEEWMWNLPNGMARAGLIEEAVAVADALADLDTNNASEYAGDAATILARAGRADQARSRLGANLARWADDPRVHIQAGEALTAMGQADDAQARYRDAVRIAEGRGDPEEVDTAYHYLIEFLADRPGLATEVEAVREQLRGWQERTGWISARAVLAPLRPGPKVGRNQPCPCGSGRKFKRCCGA